MQLKNLAQAYRKFRRENQYDAPMTIFLLDAGIGFSKMAGVLALLTLTWFSATSVISNESSASSAPDLSVKVIDANNPGTNAANAQASTPKITIVGTQWMLEQNPEHFIIQYGSSPDLKLLKQFAAEMGTEDPIAIYPFKTTPSGKPVFGIASSLHGDLDAGLNYVEQLPAAVREFGPWVRPLKNVQRQIRKTSFSS